MPAATPVISRLPGLHTSWPPGHASLRHRFPDARFQLVQSHSCAGKFGAGSLRWIISMHTRDAVAHDALAWLISSPDHAKVALHESNHRHAPVAGYAGPQKQHRL